MRSKALHREGLVAGGAGVRQVVRFDDLNPEDHVLIRTRNSTYAFRVLDPAKRLGVLAGGDVIHGERHVVMFESVNGDGADAGNLSELRRGARGLFYLDAPDGLDRLLTSPITRLLIRRAGEEMRAF